jgi:hypothetical protein
MLSNLAVSWIRTIVPLAVGTLLTWLATSRHIVVSPHSKDMLVALALAVTTAVYYSLVRLLEHYVPQAGVLLGVPAKPNYKVIEGQALAVADEIITGGPDPTEAAPIEGPVTASHMQHVLAAEAAAPAELETPPVTPTQGDVVAPTTEGA